MSENKPAALNHEALADAVLASGVNLREEEERLSSNVGLSISKRQIEHNNFLSHPHLRHHMHSTMTAQGLPLVQIDSELLSTLSAACEQYMRSIVADAAVLARHRKTSKRTKGPKSEISKALKEIARKHKEKEEKRDQRKVHLGLVEREKDNEDEANRQTNLTASLMMSGKKKKYSWMSGDTAGSSGDSGIRYREAREEPNIVLRDLMAVLEGRRLGVKAAMTKGYGIMKD
ncbi:Taf4 protein [Martiniozyma asiatica (nom. inval.)]|nr:Taf4 protein [Martiniozyma asiatica]